MNIFSDEICGGGKGILFRFSIAFFLVITGGSLYGQEQDFRSWWSVDLTKDISKNLKADLELGQRFKDNSLRYDRSLITVGLEYELFKNFEIGGGYRYVVQKDRGVFETKYRIQGDVSYEVSVASFSFQLRERIQYGYQDFSTIESYSENNLTNRSRLSAEYDIFASPLKLYASYELFLGLNTSSGVQIRDHRYKAGMEYKLSMRSDLDFGYMHNVEVNRSNPLKANILVVAYSYRL